MVLVGLFITPFRIFMIIMEVIILHFLRILILRLVGHTDLDSPFSLKIKKYNDIVTKCGGRIALLSFGVNLIEEKISVFD